MAGSPRSHALSLNFAEAAVTNADRAFEKAIGNQSAQLNLQGYGIKVSYAAREDRLRTSEVHVNQSLSLARVAALRDLSIDNNVITTLPPLQPFFRLQHLSLCHNTLKTLPRSIGDLVALETLNLAYNQLSALPNEMNNLRQLKYLGLEGNRNLQSISLELSRMTGTQIKMDGLLHIPGELMSALLILEYVENLNLHGLPVNLQSHWRTTAQACSVCRAQFGAGAKVHNCRICGYLNCAACCSTFLVIPCFNLGEGVRVCRPCKSAVAGRNFEQVPDPKAVARPPRPSLALPKMRTLNEEELSEAAEKGRKTIRHMEQTLTSTLLREAAAVEPADKMRLSEEAARLRHALAEVETRYRALMGSLSRSAPAPPSLAQSQVPPATLSVTPPTSPRWKAAAPVSPRADLAAAASLFSAPTPASAATPVSPRANQNPMAASSPSIAASPPQGKQTTIVALGTIVSPRRLIRSNIAQLPPPPALPLPPAPTRKPPSPARRAPSPESSHSQRPPSLSTLLEALGEPPSVPNEIEISRPPSDMPFEEGESDKSTRGTRSDAPLPAGTLQQARAKWSYKGGDPRELRFKAGDVIVVLERMGDEWCFGIANGRSGFFPASHVVPL